MMEPGVAVINSFYEAFQRRDFKTMQSLYADDAEFSDPVFENLNAAEARAMWEMLLTGAKDLKVEFDNVKVSGNHGSCRWQAWYTFTATGRPVHNIIYASFTFRDGKITSHHDQFDLWRWSRQALGLSGVLLGWTGLIRRRIQKTARGRLEKFMTKTR